MQVNAVAVGALSRTLTEQSKLLYKQSVIVSLQVGILDWHFLASATIPFPSPSYILKLKIKKIKNHKVT
jgi:hypothetical protein